MVELVAKLTSDKVSGDPQFATSAEFDESRENDVSLVTGEIKTGETEIVSLESIVSLELDVPRGT
jgi:hypothetical protein